MMINPNLKEACYEILIIRMGINILLLGGKTSQREMEWEGYLQLKHLQSERQSNDGRKGSVDLKLRERKGRRDWCAYRNLQRTRVRIVRNNYVA